MSISKVGFIGLGNMGLPMASNLTASGHTVIAYDPQLTTDSPGLPAGLTLCGDLQDAVQDAELIFTMLPNGGIVINVLEQIIAAQARPVAIVDCSTIDISDARKAHALAAAAGVGFLDAPVSGGIAGAAAGTLPTMVGGDETLLNRIKPVTDSVFGNYVYCGPAGAGQAAKICNNMLLAISMIRTAETFNLGRSLGLDMDTLYKVLSTSTGSCWSVNSYCPVPGTGPTTPADNDYKPGFAAELMLKDLNLSQMAATAADADTPMGQAATALYQQFVENEGGRGKDFSAILPRFESRRRS